MAASDDIVSFCRSNLETLPGVKKVAVRTPVSAKSLPRADLSLVLDTAAGQLRYLGEIKRGLTPAKLEHWLLGTPASQILRRNKIRLILLSDFIAAAQAKRLTEADIDYVDAAGNLLIRKPGKLYFFRSGAKPRSLTDQRPARLSKTSGLQVLYALLIEPTAAQMPYRQLAAQSGVALGSIAFIMGELRRKGYLIRHREGWRLSRRRALLDLWLSGYSEQLRPKLMVGRFEPPDQDLGETITRLADTARARRFNHAVTGGFAAEALTKHFRGDHLSVFVSDWPRDILKELRWLPSLRGRVSVLRQFCPAVVWGTRGPQDERIAHPLLVYAELLHQGGERARSAAEMIYERYIKPLEHDSDSSGGA